jgi:hypothetical protein
MTTTQENITTINDSTLEAIVSVQDRVVEAQKEFAAAVANLVPQMPSLFPESDRTDLVDPKSLVEQSFDFQARLLEANKSFSLGLIEAWAEAAPERKLAKKSASSKK